jgi:hypothetical protein
MYTQRLALRRDLLRPQALTSLHDHTASWLGLGAALNVVRKRSGISSRATITALYLLCIFGLHNSIPALLNVIPLPEENAFELAGVWVGRLTPHASKCVHTFYTSSLQG